MPFSVSLMFYNVHNDHHDCNNNGSRGGDGCEGVSFQGFSALCIGCTLDISYRITCVLFLNDFGPATIVKPASRVRVCGGSEMLYPLPMPYKPIAYTRACHVTILSTWFNTITYESCGLQVASLILPSCLFNSEGDAKVDVEDVGVSGESWV